MGDMGRAEFIAACAPAPARTLVPQRLAFWVGEREHASDLLREVGDCPEIAVHIYATTPPLGTGDGTVAAAVCPEHGAALDFAGLDDDAAELLPTVGQAFAAHGYLTVGGPP